jgi:hypothetical protein
MRGGQQGVAGTLNLGQERYCNVFDVFKIEGGYRGYVWKIQ